ncbi:SMI1/KNR4 family protein [Gorillibacterium sp. CAU 1737]|uniref:SMI1/KNR4 family protein n=1 Tax=Gorillibacterium sp. CAU 1737 TaxID=3140362 RepID=UPI003260E34B
MKSVEELRARYGRLYPEDGVDENVLRTIEDILQVKLPDDFSGIATFFSGGSLGGISCFAFGHEDITPTIVEETLRHRTAIKLPPNFIVLAEPPASLIIMDVYHHPSVIWCDATDAERIQTKSFISPPDTWNTYTDFFAALVENEEEEGE